MNCFIQTILIFIVFVSTGQKVNAIEVEAFYSHFPPYEYKGDDGQPTGFSMEVFQAIAKQANITVSIKLLPWKRGVNEVKSAPNRVIFTATRNETREHNYKWVGPITGRHINLYKLITSKFNLDISTVSNEEALSDIKNKQYKIGVVSGDAIEQELKERGYATSITPIPNKLVEKFFRERHPLLARTALSLEFSIKKLNRNFSEVEKVAILNDKYSYYFMFNKDTPDTTIDQFQKALNVIKVNGVYQKIKDKWLK